MFYTVEQEKKIYETLQRMRPQETHNAHLCQYGNVSCIRCCLPHIGGDRYKENTDQYIGPGGIRMKFRNFNPLKDPRIEASQYEDSFPDVGRKEMESRFSGRRKLFLEMYDPQRPEQSLRKYMKAAQKRENYRYAMAANSGPVSLFLGGSGPDTYTQGEMPECQLLGFVDEQRKVGCLAHPLAETSGGHDGRDQVGFFHHTGCCAGVGCEASKEFRFLSRLALQVFNNAVADMSWYEYSRHATSVLVYYLRGYDYLLQKLDEIKLLKTLNLDQIVGCTNILYDTWPFRKTDPPHTIDMLSMSIPLAEKILYLALGTRFSKNHLDPQLRQARLYVNKCIEKYATAMEVP